MSADYRVSAVRLEVDASGMGVVYAIIETWPRDEPIEVGVWSWSAAMDGPLDPVDLYNALTRSTSRLINVELPECARESFEENKP